MKVTPDFTDQVDAYDDLSDAQELVQEIRDIYERIPNADDIDFCSSVIERTEAISESMGRAQNVTDNQFQALRNMYEGLKRWVR